MTPPPVFFVHVMKTAGTSVGHGLTTLYGSRDRLYPALAKPVEKFQIRKLLELDAERRQSICCYSVHMPAWVADTVGDEFVRASVLREPVARTVSHLRHLARALDLDVEEIYADPDWHDRLTNYQTRIFSLTEAGWAAENAAWSDAIRDAVARGVTPLSSDDEKDRLRRNKQYLCTSHTAIARPVEVSGDDLARAIRTVDRLDVVGRTEALPAFWRDLSSTLGVELPPMPRRNQARDAIEVPAGLRARIERDHQLDMELYEHVGGANPG